MSFATVPPPTAATPQTEVAALVAQLQAISKAAIDAQAHLANVLLLGSFVPVPAFVEGTALTPAEVVANTPDDDEVQHYWVVLRGREPGLYRTVAGAQKQTHGVPHQHQARKTGRAEALAFYTANYPDHVKKWVEIEVPLPTAPAVTAPVVAASAVDASEPGWVDAQEDA
ncbi:hypothetical protein B0H17DRAFT_1148720 [Mycena rosella]|uniref:Ribonuclease H1 N-terminal domain-containing protein n=1 Tax=Mycena rosella TaxID=1033263 RepID=A0AAD7FU02_MYCRO|nr:hypothetical protein B0H17DRAFT_1148720 [Mycena rosella]